MDVESIRDHCLALPAVTEELPFGPDTLVFKVAGKIFLLLSLNDTPPAFNAKCDPEYAEELRAQHPAVRPGYHMNKKHWNTITCDGSMSSQLLKKLIDHSYEQVVAGLPAKMREKLKR